MTLEPANEVKTARPHNLSILMGILDAKERGDRDEYDHLMSELDAPPHTLMAIKRVMGAEWIRARNLRTHRADKKYGPGWLGS